MYIYKEIILIRLTIVNNKNITKLVKKLVINIIC